MSTAWFNLVPEKHRKPAWNRQFDEGYAVPEAVLALVAAGHLEDTSWSNDACPSFGRSVGDVEVCLWVEHPDPDERECGPTRFSVTDPSHEEHEVGTDDLGEALRQLDASLRRYLGSAYGLPASALTPA